MYEHILMDERLYGNKGMGRNCQLMVHKDDV
jgi:hypothetical protein